MRPGRVTLPGWQQSCGLAAGADPTCVCCKVQSAEWVRRGPAFGGTCRFRTVCRRASGPGRPQVVPEDPRLSRWTLATRQLNQDFEFNWLAQNLAPTRYQKIHWRSVQARVTLT
jgi:hypothetical protein